MKTYEVKSIDLQSAVAKFNHFYNRYVNSGYNDEYARACCNTIEGTLYMLDLPVSINGRGRMYIKEAN